MDSSGLGVYCDPSRGKTSAVTMGQSEPASTTIVGASPASVHLDAVRGIAAIAVMLSHLRYLYFMDYEELPHKSALLKVFYFMTGLGHPAVIIFFVLSGYLIASSILRALYKNAWSWRQYGVARLTRLYTVLIPALLLTAFWDHLGLYLFAGTPIYANVGKTPIAQLATFHNGLGNLFFLCIVSTFSIWLSAFCRGTRADWLPDYSDSDSGHGRKKHRSVFHDMANWRGNQ
jgi:peptidoglycan/LPS O-acetylase OafA/YrhL